MSGLLSKIFIFFLEEIKLIVQATYDYGADEVKKYKRSQKHFNKKMHSYMNRVRHKNPIHS